MRKNYSFIIEIYNEMNAIYIFAKKFLIKNHKIIVIDQNLNKKRKKNFKNLKV